MRNLLVAFGCLSFFVGCAGANDANVSDEPQGSASFELTTVPNGAQCLVVIGTGSSAFNVSVTLAAGTSSASYTIGRVPVGTATVTANVYDVACSSLAGASPSWIADSQSVTFRPGVVTKLTLNLRANNPVSASLNFVGNVVGMTATYGTTGLVMSDGTTRVAGNWWPMSSGNTFANTLPASLTGVLELDAPHTYNAHACARTSTQLLCWGINTAGELGTTVAIGNSTATPVAMSGISNIARVAIGDHHTCAIANSSVYCWGLNSSGQVGNGTTTNVSTPTGITTYSSPDLLAAGSAFTCVNTYVGVECWGNNASGQLGDGTTTNRTTHTPALGSSGSYYLTGTVALAAGYNHACAVRADGTVRCWGSNSSGQLGDGTTTQRLTATQVPGITDAVDVTAGAAHTCIRRQGGSVVCFGSNAYGQLGDGTAQDHLSPTAVPGVTGATTIAGDGFHTCAIQDNQTIQCWGMDMSGQCGDNSQGTNFKPIAAIVQ